MGLISDEERRKGNEIYHGHADPRFFGFTSSKQSAGEEKEDATQPPKNEEEEDPFDTIMVITSHLSLKAFLTVPCSERFRNFPKDSNHMSYRKRSPPQ